MAFQAKKTERDARTDTVNYVHGTETETQSLREGEIEGIEEQVAHGLQL